MFSTMNTPLLDIRASQPNGNVNFTGAFTGYRNGNTVQVALDIDHDTLERISNPPAIDENYSNYLNDLEYLAYND